MKAYKFDINLNSKATTKEKIVWMLYLGVFFFLVYGLSNFIASQTAPHNSVYMEWEKNIPFISIFIIPYMSLDLLFISVFFAPYNRTELRTLALRIFALISFSTLIFIIIPLQFNFEKPEINSFQTLFYFLKLDKPFNQLPSLHISFSVIFFCSIKPKINSNLAKYLILSWIILICLSTLFTFQHHFWDIPTGIIVGFLAVYFISPSKSKLLFNSFSTPRSIKIAGYYLFAAVIISFITMLFGDINLFTIILTWLFASVLVVSIAYAFGFKHLIVKTNSKANFVQKIFFLPYFLGNHISLRIYQKKLKAYVKVKNNVYIGRYLKIEEANQLLNKNIKKSLNLALEQQFMPVFFDETRLAFLDQTIQSPESLHKAVQHIESNLDGIYIHCALGLSRTILVISAWLIYNGKGLQEIYKILNEIQPNYVKSKYMIINLEIYKKWLEKQMKYNQ